MVNINENGIWKADGNGVGKNLIWNGNAVEYNGNYVSSNTSGHWANWGNATDRSLIYIDGEWWFHHKSVTSSNTYGGFYQDQNCRLGLIPEIKPDTYYTVSGWWFASSEIQCRYWMHMRSTEGGANISQPTYTFIVNTEPQYIIWTFNSGHNDNYTINLFNLMIGSAYNSDREIADVYFTNIKMEEGSIATPWVPNPADDIYISNNIGFSEEGNKAKIWSCGSVTGNEFIQF